jgi:hypothetical protein
VVIFRLLCESPRRLREDAGFAQTDRWADRRSGGGLFTIPLTLPLIKTMLVNPASLRLWKTERLLESKLATCLRKESCLEKAESRRHEGIFVVIRHI